MVSSSQSWTGNVSDKEYIRIGVILHGVAEIYFCLDGDQPKDSNTQRTILSRSIEIAHEIYADRGLTCPIDWVLHALE